MLLNWQEPHERSPLLAFRQPVGPVLLQPVRSLAASKPLTLSVASRFTTSSTAIPCQAMASAVGLAFAAGLIGVLREALVLVVPRIRAI